MELNILSADQDAAKQISQIEQCVSEGYDAILFEPVDPDGLRDAAKAAADAGVIMINIVSACTDWESAGISAVSCGDNVKAGENNGMAISGLDKSYSGFITGSILKIGGTPIPNYVWIAVICTIVIWFIWNKTTFGKNMFAVGSNADAAKVSGVNVFWTTVMVHTLAGAMYGVTGFIEGARISSITQGAGLNYECDAIAACVIGGVSFVGGIGKIRGIVIGVLMLRLIFVGLLMVGVPQDLQYLIKGGIILFACALDMRNYLVKK